MGDARLSMPLLDFGSWVVPLPGRGHHVFLSSRDLRVALPSAPSGAEPGVWLMRTESGVGVIIPVEAEVVREGIPVVGLAVPAYCDDCWDLLDGARCCSQDCRFSPGPLADEPDS